MQSGVGFGPETEGLGWKGAKTGRRSRASLGGGGVRQLGVRDCKRDSRRFPNNNESSQKLCMQHNMKSYAYLKREFFHFVF